MKNTCYIVDAIRTPIGSYGGVLGTLSAVELGVHVTRALAQRLAQATGGKLHLKDLIEECNVGNVVMAGAGQAPARQIAIKAELRQSVRACTLNKMCGSGLEATRLTANSILLGGAQVALAGGIESMSTYPYLLKAARFGAKMGHTEALDVMLTDGLTDAYSGKHMGSLTEKVAREFNVSREDQDNYAIESYQRAQEASKNGVFKKEICKIELTQKGKTVAIEQDEEPFKVNFDKVRTLRPVFEKDGTITAANASSINDGAAMVLLASQTAVQKHGLKPRANILGFSSVSVAPENFAIAPIDGIQELWRKMEKEHGLTRRDFDLYEINEAFSASSVAINRKLELDPAQVNVHGGAVALGHPIGCSGARIIATLLNALEHQNKKRGIASLCIGGGEAVSIAIERV